MEHDWKQKLKDAWNEDPKSVIIAGAAALTAVAKIGDSVSQARSRKAYARMINRRYR